MNERLEAIKSSILDSLDKAKTALNNKEVAVESLKVSEIPGYIRQIELNKIKLTVNCSEFESGTIKATKDGKERVGTVQDGQCIIMLPSTGTWHIEHDLGDYVEVEINGDTSAELVKKKVTFSEGECSEEKITVHVDSVTGNNSNDNFIRVKKNGVVIEVQAQLVGSDIEITNFEYEDGATYTIEYVIKDEVRGSVEVEIIVIPDNQAGSSDSFWEGVEGVYKNVMQCYDGQPSNIVFTDQKAPPNATISYWTENGKNGVARWRDNDTDTLYVSTQESGKKIILPENCYCLFNGTKYTEFQFNNTVKTIDLANIDSSKVTNMEGMFEGMTTLSEIKHLDLLDTSKVTNMEGMFNGCKALLSLNLSHFKTSLVQDMSLMFKNCSLLNTLDLSSFDSSKVTNVKEMFYRCNKLQTVTFGNKFTCQEVTDMSTMFRECITLENINLSMLIGENNTKTTSMFDHCENINQIDLSNLKFDKVDLCSSMFSYCNKLTTIFAQEWANNNVVSNSNEMFRNSSLLPNFKSSNIGISMAKWKENGGYFTNPEEKG